MSKGIHLALLLAGMDRPDLAIEDFWRTAQAAVAPGTPISCTAVHAVLPGAAGLAGSPGIEIVPLLVAGSGRIGLAVDSLATKQGPVGVVGRLGKYNQSAHRVAHAMAKNKDLTRAFCAADLIVSADPEADWAIWNLRKKTAAPLIHGPFAMANALSELVHA